MTEPKPASQYMSFSPEIVPHGVKVTYIDDAPDVRQFLIDLRRYFIAKEKWAADVLVSLDFQRDFHRQVRNLDELIARMPQGNP